MDDYLAMLDAIGMARGVLVQPAVYGTDPAALMDALARSSGRLRGVAALNGEADAGMLQALYQTGVRGLRFTEVADPVTGGRYRGTVGLEALDALAHDMRSIGLHAQLWSPLANILDNASRLRAYGLPVVLDHMAMVDVSVGLQQPGFQQLLELLDEDWLWVKLSLCRVSRAPDYSDIQPFHDALVERAPHRMLWASDWPFVRMDPAPDPNLLLGRFLMWVPDRSVRDLILACNPAQLYGFNQEISK
jgi:predicted TIM-barrel fold metal-dependent hydrolase